MQHFIYSCRDEDGQIKLGSNDWLSAKQVASYFSRLTHNPQPVTPPTQAEDDETDSGEDENEIHEALMQEVTQSLQNT